ncbi:PKD domain-containing protein [Methanosphaerula subterraneus]|uniref:PKD domain-containing protein n=1 Tax=Methanosphaerula subterraneus TaxID=3350244 RepID=UPI003F82541F
MATAAETYVYTAKWSVSGIPSDVALDSAGNVYVADMQNNMIKKFSSTGALLTSWGSFGTGDNQFKQPWGVAVDSAGNVYVTDYWNHRVQKFTSSGGYITQWGGIGTGDGQFATSTPMGGLAVDSAGNVYVADQNNNRIQKFSSTGTFLMKWGTAGTGNGQFSQPQDIAFDSAGNVYVTDKGNSRVQKFTSDGTFLTKWGSSGLGDGQFMTPWGITVDDADNVFVVEQSGTYVGGVLKGMRVQKFTSDGAFITKFGGATSNTADGFLSGPRNAVVDSAGIVYVADTGNSRIQKFRQAVLPVADFTVNVTSGKAPLSVAFTDTSTGSPTSWNWTFGDGTNSSEHNPVHTYTAPGTFTVTLNVTNVDGTNSVTKTDLITVSPLTPPVADFTVNATTGKVPLAVGFTDTSTNTPTSWAWTFGDSSTSTEQNPVHTYAAAGTFTVTLSVMNPDGTDSVTKTDLITVSPLTPPVADFTANVTAGEAPLAVKFTDTSTNIPTSWLWTFGDSTISTEQNPVHTYTVPGTYTVDLTVTNTDGTNSIEKTNMITVTVPAHVKPSAKFDVNATKGPAPLALQFTDQSTKSPTSWEWTFDDGTSSSERNPIHVFTQPGRYWVSLKVTNSAGSHTAKQKITVQLPVVNAPLTVQ